jgi:hypothetical protein
MKTVLLITCFLVALSVRSEQALVTREVFHDTARMGVIDAASKVEACILSVKDPSNGSDLHRRTFVEGRYKMLPEEIRTLIIWKLLDERSYTWDAVPACVPTYNARVRFTCGDRVIAVDFCFGCSLIRILEDGEAVGGGYFDPGSDWVFQALATSFPRDPVIRDLKQKREERTLVRFQIEMAKARDARKERSNRPPKDNADSRPSSGDSSASKTPASLGPRG